MIADYIRTFSGGTLHIPRPRRGEICIEDIAQGLSAVPRWGGQSKKRYPVAAHAIFTALLVPDKLKFDALNHDDSEAYLSDLPKPIKVLMPDYSRIEDILMTQIAITLGFTYPKLPEVDYADSAALYAERRALFDHAVKGDVPVVKHPKLSGVLKYWDFDEWCDMSQEQVKNRFLSFYYDCRVLQ